MIMAIQPTDIFLISQSGTSYKVQAQYLGESTGVLLVNRGGVSYKVNVSDFDAKVVSGDLFLVNRNGTSYKVPGSEVSNLFGPAGASAIIASAENTQIDGRWKISTYFTAEGWNCSGFGAGTYMIVPSNSRKPLYTTDGGNSWTQTNNSLTGVPWQEVAYGNGVWITVFPKSAGSASMLTRTNNPPTSWNGQSAPGMEEYASIVNNGTRWVLVTKEKFYYSDDNFSNYTEGNKSGVSSSGFFTQVIYANGKYTAVGWNSGNPNSSAKGRIANSSDGVNWSVLELPTNDYWFGVAYGNGKYVATGRTNVATSTDAVNWTITTPQGSFMAGESKLRFGGGLFMRLSGSSNHPLSYSTDGINWTGSVRGDNSSSTPRDFIFGDDGWMIVYNGAEQTWFSVDGTGEIAYNSSLTLSSDKNLDTFVNGDALEMVDNSGNVAEYTPVTSAINNISNSYTVASLTSGGTVVSSPAASGTAAFILGSSANSCRFYNNSNVLCTPTNSVAAGSVCGWLWTGEILSAENYPRITHVNGTELPNPIVLEQVSYDSESGGQLGIFYFPDNYGTINNFNILIRTAQTNIRCRGFTTSISAITLYPTLSFNSPNQDLKFFDVGDTVQKGGEWTFVLPPGGFWKDVAYHDGLWVAVASNKVCVSTDSISWTAVSVPSANWSGVAYGNGKWVAVNPFGYPIHSSDGYNWTQSTNKADGWWYKIAYGAGKFVAVSTSGSKSMYSSDGGVSWTDNDSNVNNSGRETIVFADGKFVSPDVDGDGNVIYSSDGVNWSTASCPSQEWKDITYGNGKYVAVSNSSSAVMYSTNATTWTSGTIPNGQWVGVAYGNNRFVAISQAGSPAPLTATSSNGTTFTSGADTATNTWGVVRYGGDKFVAMGSNASMWSYDGTGVGANADILSANTSTNKMLVSGGTWSNGSAVTGPEKSGRGDYVSHTGAEMELENSNQQWIDSTNRLGQKFFAKKA